MISLLTTCEDVHPIPVIITLESDGDDSPGILPYTYPFVIVTHAQQMLKVGT